ncbi:unnamed protein product [Chondrus crispus]|uniref:Uncharacterized protein n=1 Tax=Chondrus crispus TaxID=2769 RepID=R7QD56_CHOCR|nr:unnamed protein product [Chondrus crispus]CDF35713.1 unnamed protein product [Chondrus crispus]|eukprot:XP_005715532.1 unnamed protein product [Chondrus crispus]
MTHSHTLHDTTAVHVFWDLRAFANHNKSLHCHGYLPLFTAWSVSSRRRFSRHPLLAETTTKVSDSIHAGNQGIANKRDFPATTKGDILILSTITGAHQSQAEHSDADVVRMLRVNRDAPESLTRYKRDLTQNSC